MNKYYWTTTEDNALIDLFELGQNPKWRSNCGFKNGFLEQLKNKMEAEQLGCGLKASPNIKSRVKWFKQKWCVMSYMLSMSGFNFDNDKMMILCEKNVFDEFTEVIFELYGVNFITCLDFMLLTTFF